MSNELDEVARAVFNGQIPAIWKTLAPDTLKSLGNWMCHYQRRFEQYSQWVRDDSLSSIILFFFVRLFGEKKKPKHYFETPKAHDYCVSTRLKMENQKSCGCLDCISQNPI